MININEHLTEDQKKFCEYWLTFSSAIYHKLTSPVFNMESLRGMIIYEANTRQRPAVISRLLGRYYKLVKKFEFNRITRVMEIRNGSVGEGYREVFKAGGDQTRWPSN